MRTMSELTEPIEEWKARHEPGSSAFLPSPAETSTGVAVSADCTVSVGRRKLDQYTSLLRGFNEITDSEYDEPKNKQSHSREFQNKEKRND